MNLEQCLSAAREIDERYFKPICQSVLREPNGRSPRHIRWMIAEMHNGMSENKAMRWLGYIQGIMVGVYAVPLDDMKELSKNAVKAGDAAGHRNCSAERC